MAFILNNLLSSLDSSIGSLDSSSDLLEIIQALNVTNPTRGYGNSQKKTYDTFASLPPPSADFRGTIAAVELPGLFPSENVENGLYLCDGSQWSIIEELDSVFNGLPFLGRNYGYATGGTSGPSYNDGTVRNHINKFSFASGGNATNVGSLTVARGGSGQSSPSSGYTSGGGVADLTGGTNSNVIDKFPFASNANATDVGDLTVARSGSGQSSTVSGYVSGGSGALTAIDKFPFATNTNATNVGSLTVNNSGATGQSSETHGYSSGGNPGTAKMILKFPFSSDGNAISVGNLTVGRSSASIGNMAAGQSSDVSGYTSGAPYGSNVIDKFPFASDADATDVGDLTVSRGDCSGQSSTAFGYTSGGVAPFPATNPNNTIDKFPFAADANATDVGDLTEAKRSTAGQQD